MTHHPYGPDELDRADPELDEVAHAIERYALDHDGKMPAGLPSRIIAAIDMEPDPEPRWWAVLLAGPRAWRPAGRLAAMAAVIAIATVGAVALGAIVEGVRPSVGTSSPPSPIISPSEAPTDAVTPSPTPSLSSSPSSSATPSSLQASPAPSPTVVPATAVPTASDDDDEDETPEPSESDNSGPGGGGGDDDSGPGGGDDGG
ncbi:MAG TPA: hypothetical protein VI277_01610 [Candidatus Limnocylindria bacterium]